MSKRLIVVIAAVGLALAACGGGSDDSSGSDTTAGSGGGGDAESGEEIFVGTCSGCHAEDGTGIEGSGKDLTTSEFVAATSVDDTAAFVAEGRAASDPENTTGVDMPANGGNPSLTSEDLVAVSEYVKSLQN